MIADLYTQITPTNYDQILEHVTDLEEYSPGQGYTSFKIGSYINIFILDGGDIYWTVFEVCSRRQVCDSFDELLTELFITQLEN